MHIKLKGSDCIGYNTFEVQWESLGSDLVRLAKSKTVVDRPMVAVRKIKGQAATKVAAEKCVRNM